MKIGSKIDMCLAGGLKKYESEKTNFYFRFLCDSNRRDGVLEAHGSLMCIHWADDDKEAVVNEIGRRLDTNTCNNNASANYVATGVLCILPFPDFHDFSFTWEYVVGISAFYTAKDWVVTEA